jgi:hypothetical protein
MLAAQELDHAISCANGINNTPTRLAQLTHIGELPELSSIPVAYGQLLALLTEHPQAQAKVAAAQGEALDVHGGDPDSTGPVTERERRIVGLVLGAVGDAQPGLENQLRHRFLGERP